MLQEFNSGDRRQIALSSLHGSSAHQVVGDLITHDAASSFAHQSGREIDHVTDHSVLRSDLPSHAAAQSLHRPNTRRKGTSNGEGRAVLHQARKITSTDSRTEHRSGFSIGSKSNELRGELLTFGVKFYVRYAVGSRL